MKIKSGVRDLLGLDWQLKLKKELRGHLRMPVPPKRTTFSSGILWISISIASIAVSLAQPQSDGAQMNVPNAEQFLRSSANIADNSECTPSKLVSNGWPRSKTVKKGLVYNGNCYFTLMNANEACHVQSNKSEQSEPGVIKIEIGGKFRPADCCDNHDAHLLIPTTWEEATFVLDKFDPSKAAYYGILLYTQFVESSGNLRWADGTDIQYSPDIWINQTIDPGKSSKVTMRRDENGSMVWNLKSTYPFGRPVAIVCEQKVVPARIETPNETTDGGNNVCAISYVHCCCLMALFFVQKYIG